MGKTTTLSRSREAIDKAIQARNGSTLWLDLHSYGDESRLWRNIFESDIFIAWKRGSGELHLFLDSFDECLLRIDTVAALLTDEMQRIPLERFRLRIACRGALWPLSFEEALNPLWGKAHLGVYELAPLRRGDVFDAATAGGLPNPNEFMQRVEGKQVVPLAIRPITLQFLLNTYRKGGGLPASQEDLYRDGCLLLAEEVNQERRDAGLRGLLSGRERLAVAGRIAAATVYGGRSAIWTGMDVGDVPPEDVKVSVLARSSVTLDGSAQPVSEASVRDTLSCALFGSTEPGRVGWAHQSYAEYLAARHLVEQNLSKTQAISLLYHNTDGRVVPQLYGVAGWLAVLDRNIFGHIVRTDPELILWADVAALDESLRACIVEAFLAAVESGTVPFSFDQSWHYRKLAHPGLAGQIRPYLNDRARTWAVRHEAIAIAQMCKEKGVQLDFALLALDGSEDLDLRASAVYSLAGYADADVRARLKPLAAGLQEDKDDELKGYALMALWPYHMSADELFMVLTPPKRADLFFGAYQGFMSQHLANNLRPGDLSAALVWIGQMLERNATRIPLEEIATGVFNLAWNNLDDPGVLDLFAPTVRLWLEKAPYRTEQLGKSFVEALHDGDVKRRRLLEAMVPGFSDAGRALMALRFHSPQLVFGRDVPWMCERLLAARDPRAEVIWAKLVSRCVDLADVENFGRIIETYHASPALKAELAHLLEPIELGSERARALKAEYLKEQDLLHARRKRPSIPPAQQRIDHWLNRFDSGELEAWCQVNLEMLWDTGGTVPVHEGEADLTLLPGWKAISIETRARLIQVARVYVRDADPRTSEWLGTDKVYKPAWAGYRALRLLLSEQRQLCEQIPVSIWRKWAPVILAYPTFSEADSEAKRSLVKMAHGAAGKEVIDTLPTLIDQENRENRTDLPVLDATRECWSDGLKNALLEKVRDPGLKPTSMGSILNTLLEHDVEEATGLCRSFLVLPTPAAGTESRVRALVAAKSLLAHTRDASWSVVWPVIRQDAAFGKELVQALISSRFDMSAEKLTKKLTEMQVAEFYVWLVHQYPPSDDRVHGTGAYAVGPRDMVRHFRDFVLENLKVRGTPESCKAIEKLVGELPELPWLSQALLEAQRLTAQRTWQPPSVPQIVRLMTDPSARFVETGSQLLDLLIESLERLQSKLLGETPRSRFLWNQSPDGKWRPKEEDSLSDYIKTHFDDDLAARGIVLGREVQIRRRAGEKPGEDTDIYVTAVRRNALGQEYHSVSAVIEVKGCWHRELKTAMKTQLVDRYLKDSQCSNGLYVVGWFNCNSWDESDSRREHAPNWTVDEAKRRFDSQAAELPAGSLLIRAFVIEAALR